MFQMPFAESYEMMMHYMLLQIMCAATKNSMNKTNDIENVSKPFCRLNGSMPHYKMAVNIELP